MVIYVGIAYVTVYLTSVHAVRRVLLVLPLIALLAGAAHWRVHRRGDRPLIPLALSGLLLWCLVSYAWSSDPHDSAHQILEWVSVALTGVIAAVVLDRRDLMRAHALGSKLLIVITGAALVVAYHAAAAPPTLDPAPGWHGPVGGKNILGFLMALALINFTVDKSRRKANTGWTIAAAVLLIGSQSGAGLCITLLAVATLVWEAGLRGVSTRTKRVLFKLASFTLVAGGILFLLTDFPAATSLFGKSSTLTGRTAIWSAVVRAIGHKSLFGYGFAGVWYNKVGDTAVIWKNIGFPAYEAHDVYLDFWLQLGLVGLILLAVVVVASLSRLLPRFTRRDPLTRWLALILIALLVEGIVESDLTANDILLFSAVVTASLATGSRLGRARTVRSEKPRASNRLQRRPGQVLGPQDHEPTTGIPAPAYPLEPLRLGHVAPAGGRAHRIRNPPGARRHPASGRRSDFVKDAGWGTALQVMSVGSSAFMFLVLARDLGPSKFGYYAALAGVTGLISTIIYSWASFVVTENIIRDAQPPSETVASISSWLAIGAALSLGLTALLAGQLVPHIPVTTTLVYVAGAVIGLSALGFGAATIQSVKGYSAATRLPLVQQAFFLVVMLAIWLHHDITLLSVGLASMASAVGFGLLNLRVASRACGIPLRFGRPRLAHLRRGSLYAIVMLSFAIEEDLDKPLLVRFGFSHDAGLYSAAYNIVTLGLFPLDALTAATHNRFLEHDPDARGQHTQRAIQMTVISGSYGLLASLALWIGAPIVPHFLGRTYHGTPEMIRLLAVLVVFRSLTIFAYNGLMGLGRRGWRTMIPVATALVNISLNIALIPTMSWKGAVIATIAGESCSMVLTWTGLLWFQRVHDAGVSSRPTEPAPDPGNPIPSAP